MPPNAAFISSVLRQNGADQVRHLKHKITNPTRQLTKIRVAVEIAPAKQIESGSQLSSWSNSQHGPQRTVACTLGREKVPRGTSGDVLQNLGTIRWSKPQLLKLKTDLQEVVFIYIIPFQQLKTKQKPTREKTLNLLIQF